MKKLIAIVIFAAMLLVVAACDDTNPDEFAPEPPPVAEDTPAPATPVPEAPPDPGGLDDTTITYATWDDDMEELEELIDVFYELYGVTVEGTFIDWDDFAETYAAMVMAGQAPDAFDVQPESLLYFISDDYFKPLDDYIDFNSSLWDGVRDINLVKSEGLFYAAPVDHANWSVVTYNKNMFMNEGIETPDELLEKGEWTWDKFYEIAALFSKDTDGDGQNDVFGISLEGAHDPVMGILANNNTSFLGHNEETGEWFNNIDDPVLGTIMEQLYDNYNVNRIFAPGEEDEVWDAFGEYFATGRAAMHYGGWWAAPWGPMSDAWFAGELGMVPTPSYCGTIDGARIGDLFMMGVSKNSANPQAAALFIEYRRSEAVAGAEWEDPDHWMIDSGFTPEQIFYIYGINKVFYADRFAPGYEWWNPMYGVIGGEEWSAVREWAKPEAQIAVDNLNNR